MSDCTAEGLKSVMLLQEKCRYEFTKDASMISMLICMSSFIKEHIDEMQLRNGVDVVSYFS